MGKALSKKVKVGIAGKDTLAILLITQGVAMINQGETLIGSGLVTVGFVLLVVDQFIGT